MNIPLRKLQEIHQLWSAINGYRDWANRLKREIATDLVTTSHDLAKNFEKTPNPGPPYEKLNLLVAHLSSLCTRLWTIDEILRKHTQDHLLAREEEAAQQAFESSKSLVYVLANHPNDYIVFMLRHNIGHEEPAVSDTPMPGKRRKKTPWRQARQEAINTLTIKQTYDSVEWNIREFSDKVHLPLNRKEVE